MSASSPFARLGLPASPVLLAPLAGVSDHPFRRVCAAAGADLTYVEMLSATALLFASPRTYDMMRRHTAEQRLGVQLTGKSPEEIGRAVAVLDALDFDTIDLNMGCPVKKVVQTGCGSAILRDPERVRQTVSAARAATTKPLSVKIRLGWDRSSYNAVEVARAIAAGGADWMTVHGRTRADDYSVPVDLEKIAAVRESVPIPVIGNGNLFSVADAQAMRTATAVAGLMVSRGALGNPWVFRELKTGDATVTLAEWRATVLEHLAWQSDAYGTAGHAAVCMRKHLLWYVKGWPGAKKLREEMGQLGSLAEAGALVERFADDLARTGTTVRMPLESGAGPQRFLWEPKYEMDRRLDRGVGEDGLEAPL